MPCFFARDEIALESKKNNIPMAFAAGLVYPPILGAANAIARFGELLLQAFLRLAIVDWSEPNPQPRSWHLPGLRQSPRDRL